MQRLSIGNRLAMLLLMAATATWWLATAVLQQTSDFVNLPATSAATASLLLTLQWMLVVLMYAVAGNAQRAWRHTAADALALTAVAWPLYLLLWLTSQVPAMPLLLAQSVTVLLYIAMAAAARVTAPYRHHRELRVFAAVLIAALCWLLRDDVQHWVAG